MIALIMHLVICMLYVLWDCGGVAVCLNFKASHITYDSNPNPIIHVARCDNTISSISSLTHWKVDPNAFVALVS